MIYKILRPLVVLACFFASNIVHATSLSVFFYSDFNASDRSEVISRIESLGFSVTYLWLQSPDGISLNVPCGDEDLWKTVFEGFRGVELVELGIVLEGAVFDDGTNIEPGSDKPCVPLPESTFSTTTEIMTLNRVIVDDDRIYKVELAPPYNIISAEQILSQ